MLLPSLHIQLQYPSYTYTYINSHMVIYLLTYQLDITSNILTLLFSIDVYSIVSIYAIRFCAYFTKKIIMFFFLIKRCQDDRLLENVCLLIGTMICNFMEQAYQAKEVLRFLGSH